MYKLGVILLMCFFSGCKQDKRYHDENKSFDKAERKTDSTSFGEEIRRFRKELNSSFADAETSPLKREDLETFKTLEFYEAAPEYRVKARFERTPDAVPFFMPTTTSRVSPEVVYAKLYFELKGEAFVLNVYQNQELKLTEEYADYLFLPFTDSTNGKETYGGGRYIDMTIPSAETDSVVIDFNKAYNPYCAYNAKYSCPVVPAENHLEVAIKAGVKHFDKK